MYFLIFHNKKTILIIFFIYLYFSGRTLGSVDGRKGETNPSVTRKSSLESTVDPDRDLLLLPLYTSHRRFDFHFHFAFGSSSSWLDSSLNDLRAPVWRFFRSIPAAAAADTASEEAADQERNADLRRDLQALLASHRRGRSYLR